MSQTEGPLLSLTFIARRGKSPQGDFTLDDMVWFHGYCDERTMFPYCPRQMRNPMAGGRAIGYWNCTDANMLGSEEKIEKKPFLASRPESSHMIRAWTVEKRIL